MGESVAGAGTRPSATVAEREAAFKRLAESHLEASYRLANAILGNAAESHDVVHDAFISAWQAYPTLRDPARFEPWFKRIVVNACRNRLRSNSRRQATDIEQAPPLPTPDQTGRSHDRILVERALGQLKPDDRIVLALRYYHDLQVDDVATLLDVPAGTVKSRLNRAHGRLRAVLERSPSAERPR